jgi:glycosyltransferase involved in cell wall biosynthesis
VDAATRRSWLRKARLFVLPSHQENFGIAVVEALAAGLPAIVSPGVNLAREIEDAGAGWVAERAIEPLVTTLRSALSSPIELERRGLAARRFADQFRWTTVAQGLRSMYEQVQRGAAVTAPTASRVDAPLIQ